MRKYLAMLAVVAMAACGGGEEGEGEAVQVDSATSTTIVPGTDTVQQPVEVPTQDTLQTTTTTTVQQDTQKVDSTRR